MSDSRACFNCREPFFRGRSERLVCGVCWPVDAGDPMDWAAVARLRCRRAVKREDEELEPAPPTAALQRRGEAMVAGSGR